MNQRSPNICCTSRKSPKMFNDGRWKPRKFVQKKRNEVPDSTRWKSSQKNIKKRTETSSTVPFQHLRKLVDNCASVGPWTCPQVQDGCPFVYFCARRCDVFWYFHAGSVFLNGPDFSNLIRSYFFRWFDTKPRKKNIEHILYHLEAISGGTSTY